MKTKNRNHNERWFIDSKLLHQTQNTFVGKGIKHQRKKSMYKARFDGKNWMIFEVILKENHIQLIEVPYNRQVPFHDEHKRNQKTLRGTYSSSKLGCSYAYYSMKKLPKLYWTFEDCYEAYVLECL